MTCGRYRKNKPAYFECALCKEMRHASQVQISNGNKYVCSTCYVLTPAKSWCEKCQELGILMIGVNQNAMKKLRILASKSDNQSPEEYAKDLLEFEIDGIRV